MLIFRLCTVVAMVGTSAYGMQSFKPWTSHYPIAKHVVPLYRSELPDEGNFEADITVGSQTVRAVLDTGSSDTWFMPESVQCLNGTTGQPIAADLCGYKGVRLTPDPSFQQIPDTHTNMSFANSEMIVGIPGGENITFGGITVPGQTISLAKTAAVSYGGNATGLVGLAFPRMTTLFPGNDPSTDRTCSDVLGANNTGCNSKYYSPLLTTMFADGLVPPVFAFALSRGAPHAGVMTIGGVPDTHNPHINVTKSSTTVTVPNQKLKNHQHYSLYLPQVDGLNYTGAASGAAAGAYLLDTGTIQTVVGKEEAARINALFDPPAVFSPSKGYVVQCNATAPEVGVSIGGKTFSFNRKDLILPAFEGDPLCGSAILGSTSLGGTPGILGNTFLRNVLAVFDVGRQEITLASRVYYEE